MALSGRVHVRAGRTIEIVRKFVHVVQRADDAELVGRMERGDHLVFVVLGPRYGAPRLRERDPEQLLRIVLEAGQDGLGRVPADPVVVGDVGLFDAAVVGDVLALGADAVQLSVRGNGSEQVITSTFFDFARQKKNARKKANCSPAAITVRFVSESV